MARLKKIAFPPLAGSAIGVIGDNLKVRFLVVRKVFYTFLHHKIPITILIYLVVLLTPTCLRERQAFAQSENPSCLSVSQGQVGLPASQAGNIIPTLIGSLFPFIDLTQDFTAGVLRLNRLGLGNLRISKEVRRKYQVLHNAFKFTPKDDPRDRIEVEVGDIKHPDKFYPQVKLMRWDDEVNLSVRLIDNEPGQALISTEKDKIKWVKAKREAHFYDLAVSKELPEGGYEFEVILKEKPVTNKIEFSLETKGLDFFYQPELTQKEKDKGAFRPENVVGSYAVYCSEQKINWTGGKLYRTGKVGHIYRPKIIDSVGNWTWGILNIDKGILSVEIDQKFLDTAIYPIRHTAGLTFGYTTQGVSLTTIEDAIKGYPDIPSENGNGNSITAAIKNITAIKNTKCALYSGVTQAGDTGNLVTNGATEELAISTSQNDWQIFNFATAPSLSSAISYAIVVWSALGDGTNEVYYDTVTGGKYLSTNITYGSWPNSTPFGGATGYKVSIYATYTAAGAIPSAYIHELIVTPDATVYIQ